VKIFKIKKFNMADENCYISIFRWNIIRFWWNFVRKSRVGHGSLL